ncbi:hypothetical protein C0991_002195 [Blastosporella zonata]|nr:hypothetical protein C0991_002195 [Blastosporella zonata]
MSSLRMLGKEEENDDAAEVTWEDQERINTFSKLNTRMRNLEVKLEELKQEKEALDDLATELELADEDEPVLYKVGEAFLHMPLPRAQKRLEKDQSVLDTRLSTLSTSSIENFAQTLAKDNILLGNELFFLQSELEACQNARSNAEKSNERLKNEATELRRDKWMLEHEKQALQYEVELVAREKLRFVEIEERWQATLVETHSSWLARLLERETQFKAELLESENRWEKRLSAVKEDLKAKDEERKKLECRNLELECKTWRVDSGYASTENVYRQHTESEEIGIKTRLLRTEAQKIEVEEDQRGIEAGIPS